MFQDTFTCLEHQIQSVERTVALLQRIDHTQALQIVFEATVVIHAGVQRVLSGVAEWRVAEIVRERNCLHQIFIQTQVACDRASDLRHFDTVCQTSAKQIAFVIDEHLCLVLETAKRCRVNDPIAIALEFGARRWRCFGEAASPRCSRMGCIYCEARFKVHELPAPFKTI